MPEEDKSFKEAVEKAKERPLGMVNQLLPCQYSSDELLQLGDDLAKAVDARDKEEERQSNEKKAMKDLLTSLEEAVGKLAAKIRRGQEDRDVAVERALVATDKGPMVRETRTDTGEIIAMRLPTKEELQPGMGI